MMVKMEVRMDNEVWLLRMRFRVIFNETKWFLEIIFDVDGERLYFQQIPYKLIPEKEVFQAFDRVARVIGRSVKERENDGEGNYQAMLNSLPGKGLAGRGGSYRCFGGFFGYGDDMASVEED
jgi:hypothetical protein